MDKKEVLAVVGSREITNHDLEAMLKGLDPRAAMQFNSDEGKHMLLQELINRELLYLEAVDGDIEESEEYKASVEKAKVEIIKQLAMSRLLNGIRVEEGEVLDYYNQNKTLFKNPDTVKASHILVADEKKAQDVLDEINAGLDFEFAAKKYSSCPSKDVGGDLGYFEKSKMVPEFGEAAFGLEIGQISQPVKTQFGCHIIKVIDKKNGDYKPLDEVKNQITQHILLKKQQDAYLKKTSVLKDRYKVEINR